MMITTYYPTLEKKFSKHFQRDPTVPSSPSMEQHSNVHVEVKRRTTQWIQVFRTQTLSCLPYILICCHLLLFSCPLSICVLCTIGDAGPLTRIYLLHTCRNYGPLLCRPSPLSLALVALPLSLPLWKLSSYLCSHAIHLLTFGLITASTLQYTWDPDENGSTFNPPTPMSPPTNLLTSFNT